MSNALATASDIVHRLETAWNNGDGAAFGAPFSDEAHFVDIRADHHRGGAGAIGGAHQALFDGVYRGSKITMKIESALQIADDLVLVHIRSTMEAPVGPLAGSSRATASLLLRNEGAQWRVFSFHNTLAPR